MSDNPTDWDLAHSPACVRRCPSWLGEQQCKMPCYVAMHAAQDIGPSTVHGSRDSASGGYGLLSCTCSYRPKGCPPPKWLGHVVIHKRPIFRERWQAQVSR